jgi:hypothetical protein
MQPLLPARTPTKDLRCLLPAPFSPSIRFADTSVLRAPEGRFLPTRPVNGVLLGAGQFQSLSLLYLIQNISWFTLAVKTE